MVYIFYLLAIALVAFAQFQVQGAFKKYSEIPTYGGLTGADVARRILAIKGVQDVQVLPAQGGVLSDHYNPQSKEIRLSQGIYDGISIASLAVAAHECGHAIQYNEGYKVIAIRNKVLPLAVTAGNISMMVLTAGILFRITGLTWIGIGLFSITAFFQLITLPLEFDASKRALIILEGEHFITTDEQVGAKKMLTAAALTYIAAFISTLMQLLYYISLSNRRND